MIGETGSSPIQSFTELALSIEFPVAMPLLHNIADNSYAAGHIHTIKEKKQLRSTFLRRSWRERSLLWTTTWTMTTKTPTPRRPSPQGRPQRSLRRTTRAGSSSSPTGRPSTLGSDGWLPLTSGSTRRRRLASRRRTNETSGGRGSSR